MKRNYTYMVKCSDGTLYTGWTTDLEHRVKAHNDGEGAKYTRSRRPVELVYYEEYATKGRSHEKGVFNKTAYKETEREADRE